MMMEEEEIDNIQVVAHGINIQFKNWVKGRREGGYINRKIIKP